MPASPKQIPLGTVVGGRYRIDEILGEGGFGVVFRANQLNLDRPVALKVIRPQALTEEGLTRFQREAAIFQRLEHPNVVRLLDFGNDGPGGSPYLVFELLHGRTLEATLRARGPLPPARVARVATQLLKALMEAHGRGVVHRDVKPANLFLSDFQGEPDFVKVIDFGLAKGEGARTLTQQGSLVGTVPYMAPEQAKGGEVGAPADLFAAGLVLSEMVSGRPVFAGYDLPGVVAALESPTLIPHRPEALASPFWPVIRRATEKAVALRYASAQEMLAHLETIPIPVDRRASDPVGLPAGPPLLLAPPAGAPARQPAPRPDEPGEAQGLATAPQAPLSPLVVPVLGPMPQPLPPTRLPAEPQAPAIVARSSRPPGLAQPEPGRASTPTPSPALIPPTRGGEEHGAAAVQGARASAPRIQAPTQPMSAVPAMDLRPAPGRDAAAPVAPPAPEPGRRRGSDRAITLALGGTLVLGAAAVAALAWTGVLNMRLPGASLVGPARASAAPSTPAAPPPVLTWGSLRSELEIAEIDANGDGVLDFAGFCGEEGKGRVSVCAVDGATFQLLWRRPVATDLSPESHLGAAGHTVVAVDPRGVARLCDAASGADQGTVSLGSRAAVVCSPPELPGQVWVRLRDRAPVAIDLATRATSEPPRPPSCVLGPGEQPCIGYRPDESCLAAPTWPRFAEIGPVKTCVEGALAVGLGTRRSDQTVPMIFGGSLTSRDGGEAHVRWTRALASGDGLSAVRATFFLALRSGRAVSWYDHASGRPHVTAIDAAGGRTLWDAPTTEVLSLHLTPTRVYVQHRQGLDVRDAASGKLLGSVGSPR